MSCWPVAMLTIVSITPAPSAGQGTLVNFCCVIHDEEKNPKLIIMDVNLY